MRKTLHEQTVLLGRTNEQKNKIPFDCVELIFRLCPFCDSVPDVFMVPEKRYGEGSPMSWNIECPNMGCIFTRPETGDQSLANLAKRWNHVISTNEAGV